MGNSQKKPYQNVDLFIQVPKNIYQAGQTIQGNIHFGISAQKQPYETLSLGFCCKQSFLIKASDEKDSSYLTSEKFTYTKQQIIVNFKENDKYKQGQYCFPFEIKLPQNMPSSFQVLHPLVPGGFKTIEIRYIIAAQLNIKPQSKYGDLIKVHTLNILKPFKSPNQPLNTVKNQNGRTCLCFGNFTSSITVFLNKNFAITGQKLEINGEVNNTNGVSDLLALNCQLIERNIVTDEKKKCLIEKQRGVLHNVKNFKVRRGNMENFSFSYKIPDYLEHSFSIGNYSALTYFFRFQYLFKDGCNPGRVIQIPIHIETKTPKLLVNIDQIPSSYEWNPILQEVIKLDMSESYTYNTEYPLEQFRKTLQNHKVSVPSFNYFNQMSAGYPTKQPQKKVSEPQPQIQNQENQVNPYYIKPSEIQEEQKNYRKRKIFQSKQNNP